MTIRNVEPVDGSPFTAPTLYQVEVGDGTIGVYRADGSLDQRVKGDPPAWMSPAQMRAKGLFGGNGMFPGRAGPGQAVPNLRMLPIP